MTQNLLRRTSLIIRLPVLNRILNLRILSLAVLVIGWWYWSRFHPDYFLPGPQTVFGDLWGIAVESDTLWVAISVSVQSLAIGGLLALAVGILLGVLMGTQRMVEQAVDTYVNALYVAPLSALTPVLVFWFGIGLSPRVAAVFIFAVPEIIITCFHGARDTPRIYVEVARAFGANEREIFWKVIIPNEIPYIITAMRLGLGRAIKGMVLAELIITSTGLGELLNLYRANFETASLMAVVIVLMLMGIIGTELVRRFEIAAVPWRQHS